MNQEGLANVKAPRRKPKPRLAKVELLSIFWAAPNDARLSREVAAAACDRSVAWLESLATNGGGPVFLKDSQGSRRVWYLKRDLLAWLEARSTRVYSTSDYHPVR